MPVLLGLVIIVSVVFWIMRKRAAAKARKISQNVNELQRPISLGLPDTETPLQRVRDPRLAAVILMIQLIRTGSPVTAAERTKIMELMEHPLEIKNISGMFQKAWAYTEPRRPFSLAADELQPLLRKCLSDDECTELLSMLRQVAGAYSEPSELQAEAIVRLKRRLLGSNGLRVVS